MFSPAKIDGIKIAQLFQKTITNDIATINQLAYQKFPNLPPRQPSIVSFCNQDDPASVKFTELKKAKAEELGIDFKIVYLHPDTSFVDIKSLIERFNGSGTIDGIMVQLPLPAHLSSRQEELLNLIAPDKDVDGLTDAGRQIFRPATVEAVFQILLSQNTEVEGKKVAVVGSEGVVGKNLVVEIAKHHPGLLILVDNILPGTSIEKDLKDADIVFSCIPGKGIIKAADLKPGVIAYDIGLGNFAPNVFEIASEYTPNVGGIGPNTVVALMRNVAKAYVTHMKLAYGIE